MGSMYKVIIVFYNTSLSLFCSFVRAWGRRFCLRLVTAIVVTKVVDIATENASGCH